MQFCVIRTYGLSQVGVAAWLANSSHRLQVCMPFCPSFMPWTKWQAWNFNKIPCSLRCRVSTLHGPFHLLSQPICSLTSEDLQWQSFRPAVSSRAIPVCMCVYFPLAVFSSCLFPCLFSSSLSAGLLVIGSTYVKTRSNLTSRLFNSPNVPEVAAVFAPWLSEPATKLMLSSVFFAQPLLALLAPRLWSWGRRQQQTGRLGGNCYVERIVAVMLVLWRTLAPA